MKIQAAILLVAFLGTASCQLAQLSANMMTMQRNFMKDAMPNSMQSWQDLATAMRDDSNRMSQRPEMGTDEQFSQLSNALSTMATVIETELHSNPAASQSMTNARQNLPQLMNALAQVGRSRNLINIMPSTMTQFAKLAINMAGDTARIISNPFALTGSALKAVGTQMGMGDFNQMMDTLENRNPSLKPITGVARTANNLNNMANQLHPANVASTLLSRLLTPSRPNQVPASLF